MKFFTAIIACIFSMERMDNLYTSLDWWDES